MITETDLMDAINHLRNATMYPDLKMEAKRFHDADKALRLLEQYQIGQAMPVVDYSKLDAFFANRKSGDYSKRVKK